MKTWDTRTETIAGEILVDLHCKGSQDAGIIAADPDRCRAPSMEDERVVERVCLDETVLEKVTVNNVDGYFLSAALLDEIIADKDLEELV